MVAKDIKRNINMPSEELRQAIQEKFQLCKEANRMETFPIKWIFPNQKKCNPLALAEAGFYYIGSKTEPDAVCCFMCNKTLEGWEADDDPWKEHLSHAAYCKFAQLQKPENEMTTDEFIDIQEEYRLVFVTRFTEEKLKRIAEASKKLQTEKHKIK